MAFREVSVYEIREVLRLWLLGSGLRQIDRLLGVDRKTVRRYVEAAKKAGLTNDSAESAITDGIISAVVEAVRPARPSGHGHNWDVLQGHRDFIKVKVDEELKVTKIHDLLQREKSVVVPYITLYRFCYWELGYGSKKTTVRLADCDPGAELQVDFGRMGLIPDPQTGRNRVAHALIFTSVYSRHMFVFLTFRQTLAAIIEGLEAAWHFFGGVFKVAIPDNIKAIINDADPLNPRITDAFLEYSQSRGFVVDATRVRRPKDKARVERMVPFVRESFFRGERFVDLADAQRRAEQWCLVRAGQRVHGTTQRRPVEVFETEEKEALLSLPAGDYDLPIYAEPKVHPDHHIEVDKALYSVPGHLIGHYVKARADRNLVKIYFRGKLIKTHPRKAPGERSTDADDLPAEKTVYAMRDLERLKGTAFSYGKSIGAMAAAVLDNPLPWTKMRQVYRLFGLVHRYGAEPVDQACSQALEFEAIDVLLIDRMLQRGREGQAVALPACTSNVIYPRFARSKSEFKVSGPGEEDNAG